MTSTRVMLLIDADNVSVDVMEQAVEHLLAEYGALHVRRAYCTAESALKHQQLFKRLAIRPMVNLAAGKNSTDIALAVDALDLAVAERPEVMVIASSDSDFAPLVSRLREKGCRVRGFGQKGKTGDETVQVYDEFTVLEHRKPAKTSAPARKRASAKRAPAQDEAAPAEVAPARKAPARKAAAKAPAKTAAEKTTEKTTEKAPEKAPEKATTKKAPARKTAVAKTSASRKRAKAVPAVGVAEPDARVAPPMPVAGLEAAPAEPPVRRPHELPAQAAALLRALPALQRGEPVELQSAAGVLRRAGLLSRRSSTVKLFGRYPELFVLHPGVNPTRVTAAPAALR